MTVRFLLMTVLLLAACSPSGERPMNVLLIVADTLRADHLGCYGFDRPTSPTIDRLAEEGMRFTRYYSVVPTTLASFTSLLTSLHPKDHKASRNGILADPAAPRMNRLFQRAGFETAAFISSFCLSAEFGMSDGFDHFDEEFTRSTILDDNKLVRSAKGVTDAYIKWLMERESDKPYLALVHYFDPHWPYDPPAHLQQLFGAQKLKAGKLPSFVQAQKNLARSGGKPGDFEKNLHSLYCAEIRYMDNQIGRILAYLKSTGLEEDTLVVFTSDHGESFWDHDDYFNHGLFVYDTTVHIPLIVRCPGTVPAGETCRESLINLDLAPTLLSLSGIEAPRSFQGKSFENLILGQGRENTRDRIFFHEATRPLSVEKEAQRPNLFKAKSIRRGPWKYISVPYSKTGRSELYNMDEDPLEKQNLVFEPRHQAMIEEFDTLLDQWAKTFRERSESGEGMDAETKEKLEALGYGH